MTTFTPPRKYSIRDNVKIWFVIWPFSVDDSYWICKYEISIRKLIKSAHVKDFLIPRIGFPSFAFWRTYRFHIFSIVITHLVQISHSLWSCDMVQISANQPSAPVYFFLARSKGWFTDYDWYAPGCARTESIKVERLDVLFAQVPPDPIYNCVFESLISDVACNYVSAEGGVGVGGGVMSCGDTPFSGHWLSYTGCWQALLVMY